MALYKKENLTTYTLGITLTIELLKYHPEYVKMIYFHSEFNGESKNKIIDLCHQNQISYLVNNKIFNQLTVKENCYVVGEFYKYNQEIIDKQNHIVLVNPQDAGNLGTIMRTAVGFNFLNLVIIEPGVDHFNPKVVRSSMGSIFHLNIERFKSFSEYLEKYSEHDIYPFMLKAKYSLDEFHNIKPKHSYKTLVFGNEATGLDDSFLNIGTPIIIKHSNKIDSLNLPIASSVAMYEVSK